MLYHPGFRPAIISDDTAIGNKDLLKSGNYVGAAPGRPATFAPVIVNNEDQEAEYTAKGYIGNVPDPIPEPPDPALEYPKWVHFGDGREPRIAKNREEEEKFLSEPKPEPVKKSDDEEYADYLAWKRARSKPTLGPSPGLFNDDSVRKALIARARACGIEVDESLSTDGINAQIQRVVMGDEYVSANSSTGS
jgi:hypothetical protein